ncbi:MAG: hypothetical protein HYX24_02430 [Candidatus Aenigmarchaeota archaeon]|nr:hypothetical protein [Candidatus Aenigmarchaeota archaeon]
MKYNLQITLVLILIFIFSQVVGLGLANASIKELKILETGEKIITYSTIPVERPETTGFESLLFILIGIAFATGLFLLIVRFRLYRLWKLWFFFAVLLTMWISFSIVMGQIEAFIVALVIASVKVFRPNPIVHNIAEVLVYSGIVLLLFPMFDVIWVVALLLVISVYDFLAVFKTGHMVSMAKFSMRTKLFPGISLPIQGSKKEAAISGQKIMKANKTGEAEEKQYQAAILGGGDITFPMLFSSVVMQDLFRNGFDKLTSLNFSLVITATSAASLLLLLLLARKGKFYPAMPFITAGSLIGYGIIFALTGRLGV